MAYRIMDTPRRRPANLRRAIRRRPRQDEPEYVSKNEGAELLDRQARKYLQMSGHEFRERYMSGDLAGMDPDAVRRVAFLLPLSEG